MRWQKGRRSTNVEDRRGMGGAGLKLGGGALLVAVVVMLLGGDPRAVLEMIGGTGGGTAGPAAPLTPAEEEMGEQVRHILGTTEDVWGQLFAARGDSYAAPTLVLFSGAVQSACGTASAAAGPFYCPLDQQVYIDLSFYDELRSRFGAPGDFAQAYVIAHEVGHHVQNLLGIADQVQVARQQSGQAESNALSVRVELQADCLAGVWANHSQAELSWLETGDVEEGLNAAAAIGDDRLQRQMGGAVNPESWTHGSSEQRVEWFRRGMTAGDMSACDTFGAG
ncbi:MAG: KPN_02809 family neutral zinc metallopeptidase [Longimicrobiales bacterium]